MIIFLVFLGLLLIFLPSRAYLSSWKYVLSVISKKSALDRGEELYLWLDSFGPCERGVELAKRRADIGDYKHYNKVLDSVWEEAQRRGAPLTLMIRSLKKGLRHDLKRSGRETQLLRDALLQSMSMLAFIWLYLLAFKFLLDAQFRPWMIILLLSYQLLGGIFFRFFLKRLRQQIFAPLEAFSRGVLELHMIRFRGSLSHCKLDNMDLPLKGHDRQMLFRLEQTLEQWKRLGVCQEEAVLQIEEDLGYLANDKEQLFLSRLKVLNSCWALIFILPCLFLVSGFGLYALLIV